MERSNVDKLSSYGKDFQSKLLACLISDADFLLNVIDILNEEYFQSEQCKYIYRKIKMFYESYNTTITRQAMIVLITEIEQPLLQLSVKRQIKIVYQYMLNSTDLDFYKDKTLSFCKNQALKKALLKAVEHLQSGNFEKIRQGITQALNCGQSKDLGKIYSKNFEQRYSLSVRKTIPTAWKQVNQALMGGLGRGELGIVIAPSGGGKSWLLTAIGAQALLMGYNVVHYTLELQDLGCQLRYDSVMTKIPYNKLLDYKDVVNERWIDVYRSKIRGEQDRDVGQLCMKQYATGTATISTLKAHLKMWELKNGKADLVIVDYADILAKTYNRNERTDEMLGTLYESLRGMAGEFDVPIWTATQTNRDGFSSQVVVHENISDSIKKIFVADFIMSLARDFQDRQQDTGTLNIMKSRFNKDGANYHCDLDLSIGKFEFSEIQVEDKLTYEQTLKQNKIASERILKHYNSKKNIISKMGDNSE